MLVELRWVLRLAWFSQDAVKFQKDKTIFTKTSTTYEISTFKSAIKNICAFKIDRISERVESEIELYNFISFSVPLAIFS